MNPSLATRLRTALQSGQLKATPSVFDARELQALPDPVQRYFRAVLRDGQPIVAAMAVAHQGTLDMGGAGAARWTPFASTQRVAMRRPGFVWEARVRGAFGLPVRVLDAYVAGRGHLHAAVLGLFTVADLQGTPGLARAELMRWLAEAAWYPTALLPSQGVRWDAVDAHAARATLTDGDNTVSLLLRFGGDGLIDTVHAQARERLVDGTVTTAPWQGRFWDAAVRGGMRVPLQAEVGWVLGQGYRPYFRATVTALAHEIAP